MQEAYSKTAQTEEEKQKKQQQIQQALHSALKPSLYCIRTANDVVILLEELLEKGNSLLLSDVGVGAECIGAGVKSAWLTVLINLNLIEDKALVTQIREQTEKTVIDTTKRCNKIYEKVEGVLCKTKN